MTRVLYADVVSLAKVLLLEEICWQYGVRIIGHQGSMRTKSILAILESLQDIEVVEAIKGFLRIIYKGNWFQRLCESDSATGNRLI